LRDGQGIPARSRRRARSALENLPRWVPKIFPTAKLTRAGGFRVASADLGRGFEEDLGIDPRGIKYFGIADQGDPRGGRRSPVELVAEFQQVEAPQAADWLEKTLNSRGNGHDTESAEPPPPPEPEAPTESASFTDVEITRLAKLSLVDYEHERKEAAEGLNVRASILDHLVAAERERLLGGASTEPALYEHWIVEAAGEPVDTAILLRALKEAVRRYAFMSDEQAAAVALWLVFSWLHGPEGAVTHSPILYVTSEG
jgi:hypothetical protein